MKGLLSDLELESKKLKENSIKVKEMQTKMITIYENWTSWLENSKKINTEKNELVN